MAEVYKDLEVRSDKENYINEVVTGYEHGIKIFRFKPFCGHIPIDLSDCTGAAYVGTKSDGNTIGNECSIADGKILLPLTLQMTTAKGLLTGTLVLFFPTGNLRFCGVNFEVFPSPETAEIESTDEFTLLETAIAQAKNAYQIAVENGFEGTESEWLESLKGADGRGIISSEINSNGELVLTYSDGSTANVGAVVGAKGKNYQVEIIESTETTVELQPNKFYKFGEATELNLSFAEITDNSQLYEFMFEFVSGETATTLTLPDTIKWADVPTVEANRVYQCSIVNNIGLIVGVDNV